MQAPVRRADMLPDARRKAAGWLTDYENLWTRLPARTVSANIASDTPTLAELRKMIPRNGEAAVRAVLIYVLNEFRDLVNVGKNLTDLQIGFIATEILANYWYFRFDDIKYLLRRSMSTEKLYDRLDPNIVLGWFSAYDCERTEESVRISEQKDAERIAAERAEPGVSFEDFMEGLMARKDADPEAAALLEAYTRMTQCAGTDSRESEARKKAEFKKWYHNEYLKGNNT